MKILRVEIFDSKDDADARSEFYLNNGVTVYEAAQYLAVECTSNNGKSKLQVAPELGSNSVWVLMSET